MSNAMSRGPMLGISLSQADAYEVQTLDAWIDEVMGEKKNDRACTKIALVHCRNGEEGREVWTAPVNGKRAIELAEIFTRKARSVAQELGLFGSGVQMFELWAFFGDRNVPEAWHPLPIKSKIPRDGFGSEGPSGNGPEAQRMRQHEQVFQATYAKQAHLDQQHFMLITFLGNSLASAMGENARLARESIEAMARERDRSHEYRMREIEAISGNAMKEMLLRYAPALVNTAFGKEVFPQSTADSSLLKTLVESVADENPAMIEMLVGAFKDKPEIGGPLAARVAEILKEKSDREDERKKALDGLPSGPSAEEDAAGGPVLKLVEGDKKGGK
jgi:hypothetical protein